MASKEHDYIRLIRQLYVISWLYTYGSGTRDEIAMTMWLAKEAGINVPFNLSISYTIESEDLDKTIKALESLDYINPAPNNPSNYTVNEWGEGYYKQRLSATTLRQEDINELIRFQDLNKRLAEFSRSLLPYLVARNLVVKQMSSKRPISPAELEWRKALKDIAPWLEEKIRALGQEFNIQF